MLAIFVGGGCKVDIENKLDIGFQLSILWGFLEVEIFLGEGVSWKQDLWQNIFWTKHVEIWGFPKMVVPNNHGFSY